MSFRIFAAGVPDFHFVRDNNPDDDVFDTAEVLNILSAIGPSAVQVGLGVEEVAAPNNVFNAAGKLASQAFTHMMASAVGTLHLHQKNRLGGWISVATRESNMFWADSVGFARYNFTGGGNPGKDFFRTINEALKKTDLDNWGVMRMLGIVMDKYKEHLRDGDPVMLSIEISH